MKVCLLFLISTIAVLLPSREAFSQQPPKTYNAKWEVVFKHISKGLPKFALAEVKQIYQLAKKEKQDAQIIKATLYMNELQNENREDGSLLAIQEIEQEISVSKGPAKSILQSLSASLYYNFYQSNRWKLYERTQTGDSKKEDISTWGTEDFHAKISELYLQSIQNEGLLKQTKLEPYDALIVKGNMRKLRPTLYDLLAFRALDYFSSDERDIRKPAYAFEINTASAFDPAADFVHRKFETKDTSALEYKALLIYQKLIAFHLNDKQPDALIDADIQRIQFVNQKFVHPNKDQLYYITIHHIADQYASTPTAAQAWYLEAEWFYQKGNLYDPRGDTTNRYEKLKAIQICEKIIKANPDTEGDANASNLLNIIRQQSLQFSVETVNVPERPFRISVGYQNIPTLYLRLIKATDAVKGGMKTHDITFRANVLAATPVRAWQQALPETKDYQRHRVELKVDALPVGEYFLVAATGENLKDPKTIIGARLFYVSNISHVNHGNDFFVLDRTTGQPLSRARVQQWTLRHTGTLVKKERTAFYVTDLHGYFKREPDIMEGRSLPYQLDITHGSDRLFQEDMDYYYYWNIRQPTETEIKYFVFTDRAIYRPGQTVHYKGIATKDKAVFDDKSYRINVLVLGANGKEIVKLTSFPSDYGTFSGQFQLPQNLLNGAFNIFVDQRPAVTFRVEEYKRPKFYVEYKPITKPYKVNEEIQITGQAVAYAGNTIDGATVKYRVVRTPRFIYPWYYRSWLPATEPMEITHGETTTDQDGKFKVVFTALPDLKISKKTDPVFDYTVYADVTDSNGETRSGEKSVSVSYKSILLKLDLPEKLPADSLKGLAIRTENTNGEFVPAEVQVRVTQLKPEQRLIRERYWQNPDQFVMSKTEYISHFPNDEYDNETDSRSWEKESVAFEGGGVVKADEKFELKRNSAFSPGYYEIEITTRDKNNEEVKLLNNFELTDGSAKPARPQYLWTEPGKPIEPGEKATIKIGSSADHVFVVNGLTKNKTINGYENFTFFPLNQGIQSKEYTATEADRGGYGVTYLFVKHNRMFQHNEIIRVPWTNKDLKIEYLSFRDKTLPGSSEKWKVKITGYKKEQVAAEMLAGMYDASLDQFVPNNWSKPSIWPVFQLRNRWNASGNFGTKNADINQNNLSVYKSFQKQYDALELPYVYFKMRGRMYAQGVSKASVVEEIKEAVVANKSPEVKKDEEVPEQIPGKTVTGTKTQIRKNFSETSFFLPDLHTNENGEIKFSFTIPEALTRWKFQALAHTKDLAFGYASKEIVTQKDLMVQPNPPRFLREGDKIFFSTKIANLTDRELSGTVTLQLFDTESNTPVDDLFKNNKTTLLFKISPKQSTAVNFPIEVPGNFAKTLTWRIVAKAGSMSDGEENTLPVLPDRMLITDALPLNMRGAGTKAFRFDKLIHSAQSSTLTSKSLTLEYTSNPAWYAIQSLPYLMEYPYECAEQTWNRYYANALATSIANSSPRIAKVFENWRTEDTTALLSNLQKNQELKSVLLEETPWVLAAKSESEQKRNVALLFDLVRMSREMGTSLEKLKQMQSPDGGFVWFKGGPNDRYMTQYIVAGIGHLQKLKAIPDGQNDALKAILDAAIPYLDSKFSKDYEQLLQLKTNLKAFTPSPFTIQYLYMRSFFPDYKIADASQKAFAFFTKRSRATWMSQNKYMQGMIALATHRANDTATPKAILKSLSETAIQHEESGMYWKTTQNWWWHERPVERQALLIEAFHEAGNDRKTVDELRTWLLKNKQTNRWESTKATAEACYALLLQGNEWLSSDPEVTVKLGNLTIKSDEEKPQAGTGYFKKTIDGEEVRPAMGDISVNITPAKKGETSTSWGAIYWQYFEDFDKITFAETPLKLEKQLFVEKNTDIGPILIPVTTSSALSVGDKIKVRIVLRVDREMEYVHMKDMRASSLEPTNVLSSYKWQDGLGYYESTKDASTNFFFSNLNRGTYVFEYPLYITHSGDFSNGITTIQCMYAPEFTAHSEGVRIRVAAREK